MTFLPVKETEPKHYNPVFPHQWLREGEYIDSGWQEVFIPNPEYRPNLDLNATERNMRVVFTAMGIPIEDGCLLLEINQFIGIATNWLQRHIGKIVAGFNGTVSQESNKVVVIDGGLPDGYVNAQIRKMVHIAQEGKKLGATHISLA